MILRPCQTRVAVRSADIEFARRIDVPDGVLGDPALRQCLVDIGFDEFAHRCRCKRFHKMLVRNDNLGDADRFAVFVSYRYLAL